MRVLRLLAAASLLAVLVPLTPAVEAATYNVYGYNTYWSPSGISIAQGDSVRFANGGGSHTWVSDSGMGSCSLPCTKVFPNSGTYYYHCGAHPSMTGYVYVAPPVPAPSVAFSSPAAGSTLTGVAALSGTASHASQSITKVEIKVDSGGAYQLATLGGSGASVTWSYSLDTVPFTDATHTVYARVTTSGSLTAETTRTFVFNNVPTVVITTPNAGATLAGLTSVEGTGTSPSAAITKVEVKMDSGAYALATLVGSGTAVSWTYALDTTNFLDGAHTLTARVTTTSIHAATSSRAVITANAPSVVVTSPANGATILDVATFTGTATSPADPISRVEVKVDAGAFTLATLSGSGTSVSWSYDLATAGLANGVHTVTVKATTAKGFTGQTSLAVTVANPSTFDLQVQSLSGTTGTTSSTLTVVLKNAGNSDPGTFKVRFECREKGVWVFLGDMTVTSAPAFSTVTKTYAWSGGTRVGKFDVRATADIAGVVAETDESNNVGTGTAAFVSTAVPGTNVLNP